MTDKTVPVTMPDWMWGRLASIADHQKTPLPELVAAALTSIVENDPDRMGQLRAELHSARTGGYRAPRDTSLAGNKTISVNRIAELRDQGLSDSIIAAEMGLSRYQVQYHRTRAGIPPHRKENAA